MNRLVLLACAATLGLGACSSAGESAARQPDPAPSAAQAVDPDEQLAAYVDPVMNAEAIDWTAKVSYNDDPEFATLTGHMVRNGDMSLSFVGSPDEGGTTIDYRILGDRALAQSGDAQGFVEHCWRDTTDLEQGLLPLPLELDPRAPLVHAFGVSAEDETAADEYVSGGLRGDDGPSIFPRHMLRGLPSPLSDEATGAFFRPAGESGMSYEVRFSNLRAVYPTETFNEQQMRQLRTTARIAVTITVSDDTQSIVEPPAASILGPGEQPTSRCPASG